MLGLLCGIVTIPLGCFAAFMFAAHLAFTLAFYPTYLPFVLLGKTVAGITALFFAMLIYKRTQKTA